MILYSADILGDPAGWSRAGAHVIGGHARIYEKRVGPSATWKDIILRHLVDHRPAALIDHAVAVYLSFRFRRPKGHYGARGLRPSAPVHHISKPDIDNGCKLVLDAAACKQKGTRTETRILEDDRIITGLHATKRWCRDDEEPGVRLVTTEADEDPDACEMAELRAEVARLRRIEKAAMEWRERWELCTAWMERDHGHYVARSILSGLGPDGKPVES